MDKKIHLTQLQFDRKCDFTYKKAANVFLCQNFVVGIVNNTTLHCSSRKHATSINQPLITNKCNWAKIKIIKTKECVVLLMFYLVGQAKELHCCVAPFFTELIWFKVICYKQSYSYSNIFLSDLKYTYLYMFLSF